MKIVNLIVHDLAEGALVRAYTLGQALHLLGFRVRVTGPLLQGKEIYAPPPRNIDVTPVSVPASFIRWGHFPSLYRDLAGDILYAVKPRAGSYGIAKLKAKLSGLPLVLDIDDWELSWWKESSSRFTIREFYRSLKRPDGFRDPSFPPVTKRLEKEIAKEAHVTVTSHFLQGRYGGVYLPNGADADIFDPQRYDAKAAKQKLSLQDFQVLMFAGAPRPHKGIEDVLLAVESLGNEHLKVVILGKNPYDNYHEELQKRWKSLLFLPTVAFDRVGEVLAAADILLIPQRRSPTTEAQFPLKLSTAMAMGKPIITSRVGDIPEIVGDTAYLVEPDSPGEIATAIGQILGDPSVANKKGERARLRCIEKYSVRQMAKILEPVFLQL